MASRLLVLLRRSWPYLRYVVGLALAWFAFDALNGHRGELSDAETYLTHLHWQWVILAAACEAASLFSFALLQGRLLQAGKLRIGLGTLSAITLAATSIANSLPLGSALASVFAYRQYRRKGATQALAGWVVAASLVVAVVTLAVLASFGLAVAGAEGASYDLVWVTVGVLILALALSVVFLKKRFLARAVSGTVRVSRRLTGRPRGEIGDRVDRIVDQLTVVQLNGRQASEGGLWGMANWSLDCACLACAFAAVGVSVPWRGLILAYGAGQLAANLPITPGGLGVVEGSLTIALVAYGGSEASTVAAVLLYRIFNFWITLPVGWGAWLTLVVRNRRELRRSPPPPDAGPSGFAADQVVATGPDVPAADQNRALLEVGDVVPPGGNPARAAGGPDPDADQVRVRRGGRPGRGRQGSLGWHSSFSWRNKHGWRRWRRGPLVLMTAAVVGSVALAGCTAGHAVLGTGSSPCYLALPKAADAVHHRGTLVGVRLVPPSELDPHRAVRLELERRYGGPLRNTCLVAYRGKFTSSSVERPIKPGRSGTYAVAVLTTAGNRLLATFVLTHEPLRFGHTRV
ncbi:MAG TPA: YbhN family protein [Acidimicrobiales bacterium]|nr:YbhN family protein [Acidimicrobiales bacterium]